MDRQKYLADTGGIVRMHMEELLDENERLRRLILMGRLWDEAPCCLCGYKGRGYFQPETHKCAKDYEEIFKEGG